MSLNVVQNIQNKIFLTTNYKEFPSVVLIGQASKPYNIQGIHLALIRLEVTSSEAVLPILPLIELKAQ